MVSSQEIALGLSRVIGRHPEIFKGYQKIERIIEIAEEVLGDVDELIIDVKDDVLTASGAPIIVSLRLYFHNKTPGTFLAAFRIDATSGINAFKIESDNEITDDKIRERIELGLKRVHQWVISIVRPIAAEAMLSVAEQGTSIREVAQAFGPTGTMYSARTGKRLMGGLDFSDTHLPIAYSEMTGQLIDNLVTGIVRVHHDIWGGAVVSGDEADALSEFGWTVEAMYKA